MKYQPFDRFKSIFILKVNKSQGIHMEVKKNWMDQLKVCI